MADYNRINDNVKTSEGQKAKLVADEIDALRTRINALISILENDDAYEAVRNNLGEADDYLAEATCMIDDPTYTERTYGLDMESYAKNLAFEGGRV